MNIMGYLASVHNVSTFDFQPFFTPALKGENVENQLPIYFANLKSLFLLTYSFGSATIHIRLID